MGYKNARRKPNPPNDDGESMDIDASSPPAAGGGPAAPAVGTFGSGFAFNATPGQTQTNPSTAAAAAHPGISSPFANSPNLAARAAPAQPPSPFDFSSSPAQASTAASAAAGAAATATASFDFSSPTKGLFPATATSTSSASNKKGLKAKAAQAGKSTAKTPIKKKSNTLATSKVALRTFVKSEKKAPNHVHVSSGRPPLPRRSPGAHSAVRIASPFAPPSPQEATAAVAATQAAQSRAAATTSTTSSTAAAANAAPAPAPATSMNGPDAGIGLGLRVDTNFGGPVPGSVQVSGAAQQQHPSSPFTTTSGADSATSSLTMETMASMEQESQQRNQENYKTLMTNQATAIEKGGEAAKAFSDTAKTQSNNALEAFKIATESELKFVHGIRRYAPPSTSPQVVNENLAQPAGAAGNQEDSKPPAK